MKKFLTSLFVVLLLMTFVEAESGKKVEFDITKGDADRGFKLYNTKIKKSCNFMELWVFSSKHSQDEWEEIAQSAKFRDEIVNICSTLDDSVKDSWLPNLYQFVYKNANDSGMIPWHFYM